MRLPKAIFALSATLAVALLLFATGTTSFSSGIDRSAGFTDEGCICHGPGGAGGTPTGAVQVLFRLTPNDMVYEPGTSYNLTVGVLDSDVPASPEDDANKGGFNLHVNVGELAVAPGWEEFAQVPNPNEATHMRPGDQNGRTFNLTWTAPAEATEPAIFLLFVNAVNGDNANTDADHWNGGTFVVMHEAGAQLGAAHGEEPVNPEEIGVNWLAHWVGLISFAAVVATLLIYYFVLKYGESVHTTDHRDRKEK